MVEKFTRRTVAGYAIAEHAAELVVFVDDGAGDAFASQLVCRGQSGRPATDYGNLVLAHRWIVGKLECIVFC